MVKFGLKIISFVLAFVFVLSAFGICTFADNSESVRQFGKEGGYLAIGDSISRGCGADGFYMDTDKAEGGQYDLFELRNVEGSFPYLVAQAVGCSTPSDITDSSGNFWPCTYPGMTVAMMLDLLGVDDYFSDYDLDYMYYDDMLKYFGYEGSFEGARNGEKYVEGECGLCGKITELIDKASLITVQLGMADVYYRAYRIATSGGSLAGGLSFGLSSLDGIKELVSRVIKELKFGEDYWKTYYPVLIKTIKDRNPDAEIVMVGTFNLVADLTLADETMAPLGSVLSGISASMNSSLREWENEFGVLYADIGNAETLATEKGWSLLGDFKDNSFAGTHPSQKGYNYITRQILSLLKENDTGNKFTLDIGTLDSVDFVLFNGIPVSNYELNDKSLVFSFPVLGSLTLGSENEDGKITIRKYIVTYIPGSGFNASRIYGNSDAFGIFLRPYNLLVRLIKMLIKQ